MNEQPTLVALLETHRDALLGFVGHHGSGLLRFESADDLLQGVHMQALQVEDHFAYQGDQAAYGWLCALARQHIARRNAYWKALKRNAGPMLRVTYGGARDTPGAGGVVPVADQQGPMTYAGVREHVDFAVRAMDLLPERDKQLIELISEGADVAACAETLSISPAAAQRARLRAQERFRKVFELLRRGG